MHGIGEHAGRYERLARFLNTQGYTVGAHDHPGHGRSTGDSGVIRSFDELELTAAEQLRNFEEEIGAKAYLFGHSLGGLVASSMILNHQVLTPGLILSAPAFTPIISPWNKTKLSILNRVAPHFSQELPYDVYKLTHDESEQENAVNDPLNHRFKSVKIVMWLIKIGKLTLSRASTLKVPTLMLMAGDDLIVDPQACQQFAAAVKDDLITEHLYSGFHHEILNETPERRDRVLSDIDLWLKRQEKFE